MLWCSEAAGTDNACSVGPPKFLTVCQRRCPVCVVYRHMRRQRTVDLGSLPKRFIAGFLERIRPAPAYPARLPWRASESLLPNAALLPDFLRGVLHYANRSNRSLARGGSSQALRRYGTRSVLPDRSAG